MNFQDYPRYDMDTLQRKVHVVIGPDRFKAGDPLQEGEWEEVFRLCAIEYTFRRIPLISARTMMILESLSAERVLRDDDRYLSLLG